MMKNVIKLSKSEIVSGHNRVEAAERLIEQLPYDHDGRNTWLLNYGVREEAKRLRDTMVLDDLMISGHVSRDLIWDYETKCLKTV